ncbi:unnamed protein product [Albugo candida]|uniref:Uncharacterized protein n=1 Tax=Albugo candida TaxID=65357 RepID=A0A024FYS6_9STRA|nr:unnamed protein product [Albugo candida]|eukprot:CCI39739.1 unnamed protein product [Albugo candida]
MRNCCQLESVVRRVEYRWIKASCDLELSPNFTINQLEAHQIKYFTRIHDVAWIKSIFDGEHYGQCVSMFKLKIRNFSITNSMLPSAGSFHAKRSKHKPIGEFFDSYHEIFVFGMKWNHDVEVTITNMAAIQYQQRTHIAK